LPIAYLISSFAVQKALADDSQPAAARVVDVNDVGIEVQDNNSMYDTNEKTSLLTEND
jgi:hypothetical protein